MRAEGRRVDVAVVGASIVGVLVALALRKRGVSVAFLEHASDNAALESLLEVPPTPLNPHPVAGGDFAALARDEMASLGVSAEGIALRVSLRGESDVVVENSEGLGIRTPTLVYSPFGVESGLP